MRFGLHRARRLTAVLLAAGVTVAGCGGPGPARDTPEDVGTSASTTALPVDPVASFEAIIARALDPGEVTIRGGDNEGRVELTGGYEYDVRETDSLVTPIVGEVLYEAEYYFNDTLVAGREHTVVATFTFRDGRWELLDAERLLDGEPTGWTEAELGRLFK